MSMTDNPLKDLPFCRINSENVEDIFRNDAYTGNINSVDINYNFDPLSAHDPDLNILKQQNNALFQSKYYTVEEFNIKFDHDNNNLSILNANIRSISRNLKEMIDTIHLKQFAIISLTETWLSSKTAKLYNLNGYEHEYDVRNKRIGGGTSLFINKNLGYIKRDDIKLKSDYNCVAIELIGKQINFKNNVIIISIYRPPNTTIKDFNNEIEIILERIKKRTNLYLLQETSI